jgi:hypothetical protein
MCQYLKSCTEHQEDADIEKDYSTIGLRISQRLQYRPEIYVMASNVVALTMLHHVSVEQNGLNDERAMASLNML